jgi:hypothetical protein
VHGQKKRQRKAILVAYLIAGHPLFPAFHFTFFSNPLISHNIYQGINKENVCVSLPSKDSMEAFSTPLYSPTAYFESAEAHVLHAITLDAAKGQHGHLEPGH